MKNTYRLLIIAVLIMVAWVVFVKGFATFDQKEFLAIYHIDKVLHAIGGAFICGVLALLKKDFSIIHFILMFLAIATLWEIGEVFFDPEVADFFERKRDLWVFDTTLDYIFGMFGGFLYMSKRKTAAVEQPPV